MKYLQIDWFRVWLTSAQNLGYGGGFLRIRQRDRVAGQSPTQARAAATPAYRHVARTSLEEPDRAAWFGRAREAAVTAQQLAAK